MPVHITIIGENAHEVMKHVCDLAKTGSAPVTAAGEETKPYIEQVREQLDKKPAKEKKVKEEKVAEPKAEVLPPEKPAYTLQDAIDRAREIAGDGKDEKIMVALKGINTRLGISKVREIPPEKLDGYMKELNAEFPKDAVAATQNMFD